MKLIRVPVFKKKIVSFLRKEDGRISKENLVKAGALVAVFSLSSALSAKNVLASHDNYYYHANAGAGFTCAADCPGVHNNCPLNTIGQRDGHDNSLSLVFAGDTATGTHNHCSQDCHCNHVNATSHSSGGWC
jgi:hypothetical protein